MAMRFELERNSLPRPFDRLLQRSLMAAGAVLSGGLFRKVSWAVRKLSSQGAQSQLRLGPDSVFSFPLGDNYWSKAMFLKSDYEPEIKRLLLALRDIPYAFIDCGANYGYWSVQVSGRQFGSHPAVAIEIGRSNLPQLNANAAANGNRFQVLQRAVYARSGESLSVYGDSHFGLTVAPGDSSKRDTQQGFTVDTITLDEAWSLLGVPRSTPVIVKLDVEGAEVEAMAGAAGLLQHDVLFLYEDERSATDNHISRHMLEQQGLAVFVITPEQAPQPTTSLAEISSAKARRIVNFAATPRQSSWYPVLCESSRFDQRNA